MPLFARQGFAATTTKQIARAAGVSEALLFQHFPSKAALYQEIIRRGCRGEVALEQLLAMPPSTATLVRMVTGMLGHFVLGTLSNPERTELEQRMMVLSLLDDGEYARLTTGWVEERILPLYCSCVEAARRAGDLRPGLTPGPNHFWFAHHLGKTIALTRLCGQDAVPYAGPIDVVLRDAARFILRGAGLNEAAIARHLPPGGQDRAATPPTAAPQLS